MEIVLQYLNIPFMLLLVAITEIALMWDFLKERIAPQILNKIVGVLLVVIFFRFNLAPEDGASVLISFAFSVWAYDDIVKPIKEMFNGKD